MSVVIEIIDNDTDSVVTLFNPQGTTLSINQPVQTVVEVLAGAQGAPGVKNLFTGTTPPWVNGTSVDETQDYVWIDTS